MNPIVSRWHWGLQKTRHLYLSLLLRNAPAFVYSLTAKPLEGEIPVFTFHTVLPDIFERQCRYLASNGYKTLSADEFLHTMRRPGPLVRKTVVLTFDDGLKTVWTVAYPILRKYNLKAVCFLIPGCVPEEGPVRPTLTDVEQGAARLADVADPGTGPEALMNWAEIRELHHSGHVDFQSHTLHHHLVPTSERIFDFVNPQYDVGFYANVHIPLYAEDGTDRIAREPSLGLPIYYSKPRMQAERRYVDNDDVRNLCVQFVREHGSRAFFQQREWRRRLRRLVSDYRARHRPQGRYETVDERNRDVLKDLTRSREIIEARLPGHKATHLCYPWYEGAPFAVEASRRAGYRANYFGNVPRRPTNRPGDDPFHTPRVEGYLLERLPGRGRISLPDVFRGLYGRRFPALAV